MYGSFKNGKFSIEHVGEVDKGPDQYAGQVFRDHKGRNILISWFPGWKYSGYAERDVGCMTCPRQMMLKDGKVYGYPVEEVRHLLTDSDPSVRMTESGFVVERTGREPVIYEADEDAQYDETYEIDLSSIRSTVAFPHLHENARTFDEIGDIRIDQVVIGSCTNGHYKDLEEAASILKGKKIAKHVRAIIIPATQDIYMKALDSGILKIFVEAGCVVSTPTCGPCLGGHMGILAAGERAVATTNRNFVGRMGDVKSEVYLASPAVAAASAIAGKIADPNA
jgi:sucrose-6-phosphate hydrolase SacC (GH32 family)